jgi:hypothetical protein
MSWELCLNTVFAVAQPILMGDEPACAVIGSVATALQGCQVTPRDIDLLSIEPDVAFRFAELMSAHAPEECPHSPDHAEWISSAETPLSIGPDDYGFTWHFGRWLVEGMKVEIAHIVAPEEFPTSADDAGIWEAGPEIWPYVHHVSFGEHRVPVVPLEIQPETAMQRGLEERVSEIMPVLKNRGYDRELVQRALTAEHLEAFRSLVAS